MKLGSKNMAAGKKLSIIHKAMKGAKEDDSLEGLEGLMPKEVKSKKPEKMGSTFSPAPTGKKAQLRAADIKTGSRKKMAY